MIAKAPTSSIGPHPDPTVLPHPLAEFFASLDPSRTYALSTAFSFIIPRLDYQCSDFPFLAHRLIFFCGERKGIKHSEWDIAKWYSELNACDNETLSTVSSERLVVGSADERDSGKLFRLPTVTMEEMGVVGRHGLPRMF